ncbi:hypothetical protein AMAG_14384 [Allomyces macrogynus ATCC 38327]|uniref:DUF676 domain-containing protein n=1 Tax=Allomyces macrogynus (strain ATCC 38327) TaxID=578462 RepID=A0A0L0T538_ALLM3|nr:hypothetical protein AMAG_14384 [Allomyces macrogynus ATCC 38327]|eukprot:KNE69857.1 hypothetical protein AMAG_14384 [Allomyces macrogynus ATCC 38327]
MIGTADLLPRPSPFGSSFMSRRLRSLESAPRRPVSVTARLSLATGPLHAVHVWRRGFYAYHVSVLLPHSALLWTWAHSDDQDGETAPAPRTDSGYDDDAWEDIAGSLPRQNEQQHEQQHEQHQHAEAFAAPRPSVSVSSSSSSTSRRKSPAPVVVCSFTSPPTEIRYELQVAQETHLTNRDFDVTVHAVPPNAPLGHYALAPPTLHVDWSLAQVQVDLYYQRSSSSSLTLTVRPASAHARLARRLSTLRLRPLSSPPSSIDPVMDSLNPAVYAPTPAPPWIRLSRVTVPVLDTQDGYQSIMFPFPAACQIDAVFKVAPLDRSDRTRSAALYHTLPSRTSGSTAPRFRPFNDDNDTLWVDTAAVAPPSVCRPPFLIARYQWGQQRLGPALLSGRHEGEVDAHLRPRLDIDSDDDTGRHLVVCAHGYRGSASDLAHVKSAILFRYHHARGRPGSDLRWDHAPAVLMLATIPEHAPIHAQVDAALKEIITYVNKPSSRRSTGPLNVTRVSLIGFSLGAVILHHVAAHLAFAAAFATATWDTFLSIAGPHMGLLAPPSSPPATSRASVDPAARALSTASALCPVPVHLKVSKTVVRAGLSVLKAACPARLLSPTLTDLLRDRAATRAVWHDSPLPQFARVALVAAHGDPVVPVASALALADGSDPDVRAVMDRARVVRVVLVPRNPTAAGVGAVGVDQTPSVPGLVLGRRPCTPSAEHAVGLVAAVVKGVSKWQQAHTRIIEDMDHAQVVLRKACDVPAPAPRVATG